MSKKDYNMLVRVLRPLVQLQTKSAAVKATVKTALKKLMVELKADNPRFDEDKFLAAFAKKVVDKV